MKTTTFFTSKLFAASVAAYLTSTASAAIFTFNSQTLFNNYATNHGAGVFTESFDSYTGGAPTFIGTLGGVNWTASAVGGMYASAGIMSTNISSATMDFSFSHGVNGVGGHFFATLWDFTVVPSTVLIGLSDGSGFIGTIDTSNQFTGFWSTGLSITSISIGVADGPAGGDIYASAGSLSFAIVPAPGAIALIGLAGLVGGRRRRS